jgi:hypothetical protein
MVIGWFLFLCNAQNRGRKHNAPRQFDSASRTIASHGHQVRISQVRRQVRTETAVPRKPAGGSRDFSVYKKEGPTANTIRAPKVFSIYKKERYGLRSMRGRGALKALMLAAPDRTTRTPQNPAIQRHENDRATARRLRIQVRPVSPFFAVGNGCE